MAITIPSFIEADPEDVGVSSERLANLSSVVQGHVDAKRIPGAITMVARHGKVIRFQTYGSMDVEAGKPMEADAIFRIYSMTKPMVSLALMTLYEEGKFQLDDPVGKHLPEMRNLKVWISGTADKYETREPVREMTIRDLLMHTGGFPGMAMPEPLRELYRRNDVRGASFLIPGPNDQPRAEGTVGDYVTKLARMPLLVDPGAQWIYGPSTDVVGYLCEVFSGQPLDQFLQQRIFEPLEMFDTAFWVHASKVHRLAANYRRDGTADTFSLFDAPATSTFARPKTYFSGVGGLTSTAFDYMRFAKMLANGGELRGRRIIGPRTLRLMAMNHLPGNRDIASMALSGGPAPKGDGFGLGFAVLIDPTLSQTLGSPGEFYWSGAASTQFFVSPADDLVAIFMTQLMMGEAYGFRRQLRVATYQALLD